MDNYELRINNIIEKSMYVTAKNRNIIGMGIGRKIINGRMTNIPALSILVERKYPLSSLSMEHRIPPKIFGVYTDIVEANQSNTTLRGLGNAEKVRPAVGGVAIGTAKNTLGGTLGYPVIDNEKKDICILTGPGVISDDLKGGPKLDVYQPPGAGPEDRLGEFRKAIKILFPKDPYDDDIKSRNAILGEIAYIGVNTPYTRKFIKPMLKDNTVVTKVKNTEILNAEAVRFVGAKAGVVKAVVISKKFSGMMRITHKSMIDVLVGIRDAIHIQCKGVQLTPFDVGALVVANAEPNKAIGLLVAGLGEAGVVMPLAGILTALNVSLLVD